MSAETNRCNIALNTAISLVPSECTNIQDFIMHFGVNVFGLAPHEIPNKQTYRRILMRTLSKRDYKKILQYVLCVLLSELEQGKSFQEAIKKSWDMVKGKIGEG